MAWCSAAAPFIAAALLLSLAAGVWVDRLPRRTVMIASDLARAVVVLGFDGLDYTLTRDLMARGRMPNFQRLADRGFPGSLFGGELLFVFR